MTKSGTNFRIKINFTNERQLDIMCLHMMDTKTSDTHKMENVLSGTWEGRRTEFSKTVNVIKRQIKTMEIFQARG